MEGHKKHKNAADQASPSGKLLLWLYTLSKSLTDVYIHNVNMIILLLLGNSIL